MANTNAPFGFKQYSGTGSAPTYEQVAVLIASGDTNAVYFGDPVVPLNTGYVSKGDPVGSPTVQIAGIFVECSYVSISQKRRVWQNYWPGNGDANGDVTAYIVNDPNAKFLVQVGGSAITGAAIGDINANINFNYGTGNANNGISGAYVDITTNTTTNTLPFRIVGLVTDPPGSPGTQSGAYNWVIVAFNNVSTKQLTSVG